MTTQNDGIAIVLANRHYLYELLQHIFGHEPSPELLKIVTSEHTQEALELFLAEDEDEIENESKKEQDHGFQTQLEVYSALSLALKQALEADVEGALDKLTSEYTYLMIGPNKLPAPPWESVYLTKERIIFQESTLKVRRTYLKYHFLPANYPHEADDHLAFELDFMAHLAKLTMERFDKDDIEEVKKLLSDQKVFLEEHLLVWIGDFAKEIQQSRTHYFYPQIASLTEQVLKVDKTFLDEILSLL